MISAILPWLILRQSHTFAVTIMQVKALTIEELKDVIRETVIESLKDLLPDPDAGKIVKEHFQQELLAIRQRRKAGTKNISAEEVKVIFRS